MKKKEQEKSNTKEETNWKQSTQCTYNVKSRRVRGIIAVVEKE
jgi:hypothetical protein